MTKTFIHLDPSLDRALAGLAAREGVTKAEYIRRLLEEAVRGSPRSRIRAIGDGAGQSDVSDDVDRHLAETGFGQA